MTLDFSFEFEYANAPEVLVVVRNPRTQMERSFIAIIDTGAEVTLLDRSIADFLALDFTADRAVRLSGLGGGAIDAGVADVELRFLDESALTVTVPCAFLPGLADRLGNLIGLDVLAHFDFGLSHARRRGYLGRVSV